MEHDHDDVTGRWPGFGAAVKDLAAGAGVCAGCEDARCPVGHPLKLMAYRARWADLVARHGPGGLVEAADHPHGVDLLRTSADGTAAQVWEFARDEPDAIAQAFRNLGHVRATLRARGIAAEPGPDFDGVQWRGYFTPHGAVVRVRSLPGVPGIEVFEVFECDACLLDGDWLWADLGLRSRAPGNCWRRPRSRRCWTCRSPASRPRG